MTDSFRQRRAQLVVGVLLAALGFAAAAQIRLTHQGDSYAGKRREDLIVLLDSLSAASDRVQTQINELESTRSDLLSSSQRRQVAVEEARERLRVLGILAGTLPAEGPGVTVTITDPGGAVTAASILNGIEELRDAGAEAIELNNRVRVVASTSFSERNGAVVVDGQEVRPPYVVDAIGSSHTLSEAVIFPGGLADHVGQLGGDVTAQEVDVVKVTSLHVVDPLEYSQPTDE